MKIVSSGKALHTSEFHQKRARKKRLKRLLGLALFILLIGLPLYLARLPRFLINNIEVQGANVVRAEDIIKIASSTISGRYGHILPRSNSFIYPGDTLEKTLEQTFPRLRSAIPTLESRKTLEVYIEERTPYALYCRDISNLELVISCYFLDDTGYIFDTAPAFSGEVYFIYSGESTSTDLIATQFLTPNKFRDLADFIKGLEDLGIYAKAFEKRGDEYHLLLANGGKILWMANDSLPMIRSNLEAFFDSDEIKKEDKFLDKVEYLDLRIENKVRYKFQ
jgi:hypothetical protein